MIAIICLFIPSAILVWIREKVFKSHENAYKSISLYVLYTFILNGIMILVLYFIFDNYGRLFFKLNHYPNFAFKYFALAMVLALAEPVAEKLIKKVYDRMMSAIPYWSCCKNIVWKVILTLIIVVAFLAIGSFKAGYHVDEMFTLGLSNKQSTGNYYPSIIDGSVYSGQQLWREYTMVGESNRFDYGNVIENQAHDVHPPLYYAVVHTIFSLFPNSYNIYFPLIVNIGFAVIVFWQMVWLFQFFTKKQGLSVLFSLLFIFTMGFVNSVVFFRMYVLLAVWTNALIMLFCKYSPAECQWKYNVLLVLILTGGTMTQYYFVIFAFFACAIYAIRLFAEKNWKGIFLSGVSVAFSVGISTLIFPAMWRHIFRGYRGREAFSNLRTNNLWESLWSYLKILNLRVFGNIFVLLLFFGLVLFIVRSKEFEERRKATESRSNTKDSFPASGMCSSSGGQMPPHVASKCGSRLFVRCVWGGACNYIQLAIPVICYVLTIAKIAPYKTDRYVINIMGLLFLLIFVALIEVSSYFSKHAIGGIIVVALLVVFCSYQDGVPYLYRSEKKNVTTIENLDYDVPCLYLYDTPWHILPNYLEMANLSDIVFVKDNNLDLLEEEAYKKYDKVLVYIISTMPVTQVINQLLDQNSELSSSKKLFTNGYATAYYLE